MEGVPVFHCGDRVRIREPLDAAALVLADEGEELDAHLGVRVRCRHGCWNAGRRPPPAPSLGETRREKGKDVFPSARSPRRRPFSRLAASSAM